MENKLPYIVSDLDGTIAKHDSSIDHDTVLDILEYQKLSNNKFTFATGRSDIMCREIVDILQIKNPVISCNGAMIRNPHTNEVLNVEYVDSKVAYECFVEAIKLDLDIVAYDEESIIVTKNSKRYRVWNNYNKRTEVEKYKVKFTIFDSLEKIAEAIKNKELNILKVLIDCSDDDKAEEAEGVFKKYQDQLNFTWSGGGLLDAMKKGISKKTGLLKYSEIMNIDPTKVIMFGDNYNDIEIVSYVDKGVAMGNAVQMLKDVAYYVTDTIDNNGVGKVLKQIEQNKF